MHNLFIDLPNIIGFYLTTLVIGLIGSVVTSKIFGEYPDKGYGFNRIISLLLVGYISWILRFINLDFSPIFLLSIIGGIIFLTKLKSKDQLKIDLKAFITTEILFIICFTFMIFYRGSVSSIKDIEKFMDFAIYNGLYRGSSLPPQDVWYAGLPINYYYFGHFIFATLNRITKIQTSISYNLNIALLFGMSATAIFSIVYKLAKNKISAFIAALTLVVGGNLHYIIQFFKNGAPNYFYADARSLIKYGITEFPAYSFVISDFHAHIIDIPFVLLALALIISAWDSSKLNINKILLIAFSFGTLFVVNSWDYFIYLPLFLVVHTTSLILNKERNKFENIVYSLSVIPLSIVLFLPFHFYFNNVTKGIGFKVNPISWEIVFTMFGFFFILFIVYLLSKKTKPNWLILLLFSYALLMILVPSFLYLKDIYFDLNPPYYRANTIFKFWYQAWIMLTICSGYFISYLIDLKNKRNYILAPLALTLCICIFVYPIKAYKYVIGPNYQYKGLDGSKYLENTMPGELRLINYLNQNIKGQSVLLEAVGSSYSLYSVISAYTGLPTIMGWNEHELGWRNNWPKIANRMGAVERLYESSDNNEINELLVRFNVKYAVVGFNERQKYGPQAGDQLQILAKNKWFFGDTTFLSF